jgi:hypothetical protein
MQYDPSDDEHRELMEYLLSEGAAFFDGFDEDGEAVYGFDMDVLEEVMPELHQVLQNDIDEELLDLFKQGLIEVSYDEELNANFIISEEGKRILSKNGFDFNNSEEEDF